MNSKGCKSSDPLPNPSPKWERGIEKLNDPICDQRTNRQRAFPERAGAASAIYAPDLANATGGSLPPALSGITAEVFIHGFVQAA